MTFEKIERIIDKENWVKEFKFTLFMIRLMIFFALLLIIPSLIGVYY